MVRQIQTVAAQRLALAASGWAEITLGSRRKLEARKRLEKRAESHLSAARLVGCLELSGSKQWNIF